MVSYIKIEEGYFVDENYQRSYVWGIVDIFYLILIFIEKTLFYFDK